MIKISKEKAKKVYAKFLQEYSGFSKEDALEKIQEELVCGFKVGNKYLIKIRMDNMLHQGTLFELIKFGKQIDYKTLIKRKNKYFQWQDDGNFSREISI